jgi:hypothetical protein
MKNVDSDVMHQHIDKNRVPFGKFHSISKLHKKSSTMLAHDFSILKNNEPEEKTNRRVDT